MCELKSLGETIFFKKHKQQSIFKNTKTKKINTRQKNAKTKTKTAIYVYNDAFHSRQLTIKIPAPNIQHDANIYDIIIPRTVAMNDISIF